MKPGILVTRALFPEVIDRLAAHFEVDYHPEDRALPPDQLAARLAGKDGAITLLSDRIDAAALGNPVGGVDRSGQAGKCSEDEQTQGLEVFHGDLPLYRSDG